MKQHYIPRSYLKRFSNNKKSIYTYDKKRCKKYNAPLMSVCFKDNLYTISEGYVKKNKEEGGSIINTLSIETNYFANTIEPLFTQLLSQIDKIKEEWLTGRDCYCLNFLEKRELAIHIAIQYLRLPQIGATIVDDYIRMGKADLEVIKEIMAVQTGNEDFRKLKMDIVCERPALHASLSYLNIDLLMMFANAMANNIFVFWMSKENDFYTSDFPIVVLPHKQNVRPKFGGLAQYGGEVTFPLSPNLVLSMYDREYFKDLENWDGNFIEASDTEIRKQNYLRYMYAEQHVFNYKNDFSLIDFVYSLERKHPFWMPNHKTEIVSGLGRY